MTEPSFLRRFIQHRLAVAGALLFIFIAFVAFFGPTLYPQDPWAMDGTPGTWPGEDARFPLGTDALGRDVLSGLIAGTQVTLLVGVSSMLLALLLGIVVGSISGYFRGKVDLVCLKLAEVFQTTPLFIFVLTVVAITGPSFRTIVLAIALSSWPTVMRLVRAEFLTMREREFVKYCVALGMSEARIIATQILPNAVSPAIVYASLIFATAILAEAALSFLGLSDPNIMSWGAMIGNGRESLRTSWYLSAIPGLAILVTVLAINLMGEGVNDALNPRSRRR